MIVLTVVFYTRNSRLDDYFTHLDLFVKYSTNIIGLVNNRNKDLMNNRSTFPPPIGTPSMRGLDSLLPPV